MRRVRSLRRLPVLLLGVLLAIVPAATATAETHVYGEVAIYSYDDQDVSKVSMSGDLLAVSRTGRAVEVMRVDDTGAKLDFDTVLAPEGMTRFGYSLAIDEASGRLFVGTNDSVVLEYVLSTGGGGWRWLPGRTFVAAGSSGFGESLSVHGDRLAVGAYDTDFGAGAAYVIDLGSGAVQRAGVTGLYLTAGMGDEVLLTDRYLIANAHMIKKWPGDGRSIQTGGVYIWDLADLSAPLTFLDHPLWGVDVAEHKTRIYEDAGGSAGFGYQIAVTDDYLWVSSPADINYTSDDLRDPVGGIVQSALDSGTTTQGAMYRFSLGDFTQVGPRIIPPPHEFSMGHNMTAVGNAVLVSAETNADGRTGRVHVYDADAIPTTGTPGDLMRQQPEPVQDLQGSDSRPGDRFGALYSNGVLAADGGRAIIASKGSAGGSRGKAYLFSPIVPNVVEWPMTFEAPDIVYGQEGRIVASVPGLTGPVRVTLALDGDEREADTNADGVAEFVFRPAQHPAGTYPAEVSFLARGGLDSGHATGEYVVRKAPTTVVNTKVEVR